MFFNNNVDNIIAIYAIILTLHKVILKKKIILLNYQIIKV